jgi:putative sterol carrier protein
VAETFDPTQMSPEEFAGLVAAADDDQITEVIHGIGTEKVLDRIFDGMQERFVPDRAKGVDATTVFVVTDDGSEYPYTTKITDGSISVERGTAEDSTVTITTDLVSFARLIAGQADGPQLFMTGKLKLQGDMMFATRIMTFFDRPTAGV